MVVRYGLYVHSGSPVDIVNLSLFLVPSHEVLGNPLAFPVPVVREPMFSPRSGLLDTRW
jgi:hypothetical protein